MPSTCTNRNKIDEIKTRLDIVDVIGQEIILHCDGNGEYVGSVPPVGSTGRSLKVNKKLQLWNDTKNCRGGDVLDWIGRDLNDPRGSDFPKVLGIAAELAGVELTEMTEKELEAVKEKVEIHNLFDEVVEILHKNLAERPELYDYLLGKWSITRDTTDRLKIGYATTSRDLSGLDERILRKSGLVYVKDGKISGEVFNGRIIFPYWGNGKPVYFIGRETSQTPEYERKKGMKYKKLLVHNERHEYVNPCVQNSYLYGEDSLRGADYCIITEGVADCIVMLQADFPCISPVTVRFRDEDYQKLQSLTKGLKRVYVCNDNELNGAGLQGALSTAEALENEQIEALLIILPKPEGIDKIDIADYMKDHSPEDFKGLMGSSVRLWQYKLNKQVISQKATSLERLSAFKRFISFDLNGMHADEWEVFVNNEVAKKFQLKAKEIKTTVAEMAKEKSNKNDANNFKGDAPNEKTETEDRLSTYPEHIIDRANDILNNGDPFDFILNVWNRLHVGDTNIGENLLSSIGCTQVINAKLGAHQKPSGGSGKGKSDAFQCMILLLPAHKCIVGSMSSKALFYDPNLKPGTITYTDDAQFSQEVVGMIKQATSDFQTETTHRTVNADRKSETFSIPPRTTFWLSSVDSIQDEQLATRFYFGQVDESPEQDERVYEKQKERMKHSTSLENNPDILMCRCVFEIMFQNVYEVAAPYIDAVSWNDKEHRRNHDKFLDMLAGITVYNFRQRYTINGMLVSTLADYDRAIRIYNGTAKSNALCLNEDEQLILRGLSGGQELTSKDLYTKVKGLGYNKSEKTMTRMIKGEKGNSGMLKKVNDLNEWIDIETTSLDPLDSKIKNVSRKVQKYQYGGDIFKQLPDSNHVKLDCILFQTVASIDREKAERLDKEWRENGGQCPLIAEDTEDIRRHQKTSNNDFCINDCSSDDNNIVYINKDIRRQEIVENVGEQNYTENVRVFPSNCK